MTASSSKPFSPQGIKFPKALVAAGLAAVLVGCGGGSSDDSMPDSDSMGSRPVNLPTSGRGLPSYFQPTAQTFSIPAGQSHTSEGVVFSCASDGGPCQVTIGDDGTATSTGGAVMTDLTLAAQDFLKRNDLDAKRTNAIAAISVALSASKSAIDMVTTTASPEDVKDADTKLEDLKKIIDGAREVLSDTELATYESLYDERVEDLNMNRKDRLDYIAQQDKKMRDDHAKLWVAAINDYKVKPAGNQFSSLRSEVTDLRIDDKNNIRLDNEIGDPISPMNHTSPSQGWTAKRFTKTAGKNYGVVVTNNSELPRPRTYGWAEHFYEDHPGTGTPRTTLLTPMPGVTPQSGGHLEFQASATSIFNTMHFGGTEPSMIEADKEVSATFYGVPGKLKCTAPGAACRTSKQGEGTFIFDQSYTFTPDPSADPADPANPLDDVFITVTPEIDSDHLAFGYWITETETGSQSMPQYNIHTFAEDYTRDSYGNPTTFASALRGSASYSGGAVGVYVLKENITNVNPDLYNGEFVAGVDLKAQFEDSDNKVAESEEWKITGTIDNFRSVTESSHNLRGWELKLEADLGTNRGSANPGEIDSGNVSISALTNPVTKGGANDGTWSASFFGSNGDNDADDHPEAIAGEFNGHFVNGHVVGAFGAEKED